MDEPGQSSQRVPEEDRQSRRKESGEGNDEDSTPRASAKGRLAAASERQEQKGYCLYKRKDSPFWWVKLSLNGRDFSESTKQTDRKKAERFAQQRMAELRTDTFLPPASKKTRVEELIEDLFSDYDINGAKSIDDAKTRWSLHLKPYFGLARALDVSNALLKRYVVSRHSEGASNGSINRELALLKRAFNLGYEARKVREIPVFPHLEESQPRKGFLEEAQYRAIVDGACLWFRAIVETGRTYGWRISELLNLRVGQIDLLSRTIRLDDSKNGEGRLAVMTDAVYTLVTECVRGKSGDKFVFTRDSGDPVRDFRVTWRKACIAAGVGRMVCPQCNGNRTLDKKGQCPQCSRTWKTKEQRYVSAIFHDWRRTAVRDMVRNGIPERVAMTISGHKTRSVFDRYNIVNESDLRDAALKMNQRNQTKGYETATSQPKPTTVAKPLIFN
jgi:integrase